MKKLTSALLILVTSFSLFAQRIKQGDVSVELTNNHNIFVAEPPSKRYSVLFATDYQSPEVALAYIDYDELQLSEVERPQVQFSCEKSLGSIVKVRHNWYNNTGYDRGHLISNDFFNFDYKLAEETFRVYNISPQIPELNRKGDWRKLEEATEKMYANADGRLYQIVGVILDKKPDEYKTIGKGCVVPSSFYKILLVQDLKDGSYEFTRAEVWLFSNEKETADKGKLLITTKNKSIKEVLAYVKKKFSLDIKFE